MEFDAFKRQIGVPLFDTVFVRQALGDYGSDEYLAVQFSRWVDKGKLIKLRRGLYALPDIPVSALAVANHLVVPSYISGEFALSWYGLIPDAAWTVTSACLRAPRNAMWQNPYGAFSYHQVKLYEGFTQIIDKGAPVYMAEAEKALLDCWYWQRGEWNEIRHQSMHYQELQQINISYLLQLTTRFRSPRMRRAAAAFRRTYHRFRETDHEAFSL